MGIGRVKIVGAGSIGNHLAHASRLLGWDVVVCDVDPVALSRMRDTIYPCRYGSWDPEIKLVIIDEAPRGGFDLICIGTPPEYHVSLALEALLEEPAALQIEKPLCPPSLDQAQLLLEITRECNTKVFVGYDHVVGKSAKQVESHLLSGTVGEILTLDVEFREHWEGIFNAHPWLDGPADSYLGYWQRGGGASGEHSHALNLWQHIARFVGGGQVVAVDGMLRYRQPGRACYDEVCLLNLQTESGLVGRVVQDVVTRPARKMAIIQGTGGTLQWINGYSPGSDAVIVSAYGQSQPEITEIPKTRPDDFIEELKHIDAHLSAASGQSSISLENGLDTALVLAAAHWSEREGRRAFIDRQRGHTAEAIGPQPSQSAVN